MKRMITRFKFLSLVALTAIALIACKEQSSKESELPVINIAEALKSPTSIKLSQLGSKISYIPLELTDSSLVGARLDGLVVTSNYIFVSNNGILYKPYCLAFDRMTGKFLSVVGHNGQDPQAYSKPVPVFDKLKGNITFPGMYDNIVTYSIEGKYEGNINIPVSIRNVNTYVFDKEDIIVYNGADSGVLSNNILKLSSDGVLLDSLNVTHETMSKTETESEVVNSVAVGNTIGTLPGMVLMKEYSNKTMSFKFVNFRWLWNYEDKIRFYNQECDTIYDFDDNNLVPKYAVNLGTNYTNRNYGKVESMKNLPVIRTFFENSDILFFLGNAGIGTGQFFAGIYDKANDTTIAGIITTAPFRTDGFENDIDGFMPVLLTAMTENGEFAGFLTVEQIQNWIEAHPDYQFPQQIAWIKDIPEDSNPIVVVVSK